MVKIDLACGANKKEGYIGVDFVETSDTDVIHDLNQYPWPFDDGSADEIHCSHYIEHIPHDIDNEDGRDGLIQFMDEVYRILKPGGKFHIIAPYYKNERAFGDPTHRRYIGDLSFVYWNKEWRDTNNLSHYGINCDFDVKISYHIDNELTLKSEEIRNEAFKKEWNAVNDIIVELEKR
jgi:SAM-dependent methyltransferase